MTDFEQWGVYEEIRKRLAAEGIDPDDHKARTAVGITLQVLGEEMGKIRVPTARETFQALRSKENFFAIVGLIIGGIAAVATLVGSYPAFLRALELLRQTAKPTGLLIGSAFAQSGQSATGTASFLLLAPLFIYVVYVLFAIAYIVMLFGVFLGKQPKDRANAMTIFQNLNAFFIGAMTGKL